MTDYLEKFPEFRKEKSVCFTGPRPMNLPRGNELEKLKLRLSTAILLATNEGKNTFFTGCQAGFDTIAAEQVIALRHVFPQIRCFCVAPFSIGFLKGEWWTSEWRKRAKTVFSECDFCISLHAIHKDGAYYERNRVMVDCSSLLITYCQHKSGGTWYTISYASKKGICIQDLNEAMSFSI